MSKFFLKSNPNPNHLYISAGERPAYGLHLFPLAPPFPKLLLDRHHLLIRHLALRVVLFALLTKRQQKTHIGKSSDRNPNSILVTGPWEATGGIEYLIFRGLKGHKPAAYARCE